MSQIEEFKAGVTACLRSWSAFRTAVESGWGGGERESQAKADDLRTNIFECMDGSSFPPRNVDVHGLADSLAVYLEEEFSVTLEDGSEMQVAEAIFAMYEGCHRGDFALAREMVARASGALEFNAQFPVQIQATEHDDEDEEMTHSSTNPSNSIHAAPTPSSNLMPFNYSEQPLFGKMLKVSVPSGPVRQLGDSSEAQKIEVEMDDDGFAPVKRKGR
jgi:pre-rRNA-processing protein TSR2